MPITVILLLFIALLVGSYFYTNLNYRKKPLKKAYKAGFREKQTTLHDGTVLNYVEGAHNGKTPLLLIHGQGMIWEDYAKVLPGLAKHYHVYAIDCHGHGKSDWNADKYTAQAMAEDFMEFIEIEIGEKTVVSGHSSGGMIAAWMASYYPEMVLGTVIEDAPFFSTELDRRENTYVWVYSFQMYEDFKNQNEVKDYFAYALKNSYWRKMFRDFLWNRFSKDAIRYHEKHPNEPVHLVYLPPQINRMFESETYPFDRKFGETFYDHSWFKNYNQADVLSRINRPTVFLKANTTYDGNLLVAALSDDDADRVVRLVKHGKRINIHTPGHDIHYDKPKEFTKIMIQFLSDVQQME